MISACSCLSTSFRKSMSGPRIDDGCDALFFIATLRSCDDRAIIKISVNFEFLWSCLLREYAFLSKISSFTASCFIVPLGSLRISLHRTFWCCLFLSESNSFEKSCVKLFQSFPVFYLCEYFLE